MVDNESLKTLARDVTGKMGLGLVKIYLQRVIKWSIEMNGVGDIPLIFQMTGKNSFHFSKENPFNALKLACSIIF